MPWFLSKKFLYTTLLLFLPALILISWFNVTINNFSFNAVNYVLMFLLPSLVVSSIVSFMTADRLDDAYHYTLPRVLFTFTGLVGFLLLFSFGFKFLGYQSQFVTLLFPSVLGATTQSTAADDLAVRFYSLEITGALVMLAALFALASFIFKTKPRKKRYYLAANEIASEDDSLEKKKRKGKKSDSGKKRTGRTKHSIKAHAHEKQESRSKVAKKQKKVSKKKVSSRPKR